MRTTITAPGTTEEVTVTATRPEPVTTAEAGGLEQGMALTDEATGLMRAGRWEEALAVAQQAYGLLRGSGEVYEAYAAYDVGRSLVALGRCGEAAPYLNVSERIQGQRDPIDEARAACERGGGKKGKKKGRNDEDGD